jgi:hypothetical protein
MTDELQDIAVGNALARAIGHPAPFAEDELAAVRELRIVGAAALGDLARCRSLQRLEIVGSDITGLVPSSLRQLRALRVLACPVETAEGLIGLDHLEELRLDFTFVADATPIFALPSLRRARLLGNPWTEDSWRRLRDHGLGISSDPPRPIFELGESDMAVETTRQLRKLGVDLCFAALDALRTVLVRPGRSRTAGQDCDWTVATASGAWLDDSEQRTTDDFFDMIRDYWTRRGENAGFDFESHRELGDRDDALRWVSTEADAGRRALLERFVARFPGAVFVREDETFQSMVEQRAGVALPAGYQRARRILVGAWPERAAEFRIDRFEGSSPRVTSIAENKIWYRPWFEDYATDEGPTIRDVARAYPFAAWHPGKRSSLGVALDEAESAVYEFSEWDFFEFDLPRGQRPQLHRVYGSYAELLAHIVAFKLPDGTVIEALPGDVAGDGAQD